MAVGSVPIAVLQYAAVLASRRPFRCRALLHELGLMFVASVSESAPNRCEGRFIGWHRLADPGACELLENELAALEVSLELAGKLKPRLRPVPPSSRSGPDHRVPE